MTQIFARNQILENESKIVVIVLSGVGGVQSGPNLLTELQQAHKPNLNAIARKSCCSMLHPIAPGIIPDPSVAFLALLGYKDSDLPITPPAAARGKALLESFGDRYRLRGSVITTDKEVKFLARELEIPCPEVPSDFKDWLALAKEQLETVDFCLLHFDAIAHAARRGDYYEKVKAIETIDKSLATLDRIQADVLAVTGDYSLPTTLAQPSWHPVPLMIQAAHARKDMVQSYDELSCSQGGLGFLLSRDVMPLLLAHAGRLSPRHYSTS
ncbi:hypothetical protein JW992_05230 [candidate division KSB1 bacterium]|nr:hypothetical protein [candidate division KSB1 bacterium]